MARWLVLLVVAGCGGVVGTHEEAVDATLKAMKEVAEILGTVKDKASAEAAKPRLEAVAKRMGEIVEAVEELGEPKDVAALEERMRKGLEPVSAAIEGYLERIQGVPGMEAILMEPFRAVTGRVAELRMRLGG